jgi:hypothetical protein
MGVRGTKFQAAYSPLTNKTSLVTVEGEVVMAKAKASPAKELTVKEANRVLNNSREVVSVKPGKFASTTPKIAKPTIPVNVAPKQFDVLAKSMDSKNTAKLVMNDAKDDLDANEKIDLSNDYVKYRAGGYVDFATGEYVAPQKNSKLDKQTNTYVVSDDKGQLDEDGSFNVKEKSSSWYDFLLPQKFILGFFLAPYGEDFRSNVLKNETFKDKDTHHIGFTIGAKWSSKLTTILRVGGGESELDNKGYPTYYYDGGGAHYTDFIFEYILNDKWTIYGKMAERSGQIAYVNDVGGVDISLRDDRMLGFGVKRFWSFWKNHNMRSHFDLSHIFTRSEGFGGASSSGTDPDQDVSGKSLYADFGAEYSFWNDWHFYPAIWSRLTVYELKDYEMDRFRLGLSFEIQKHF